MKIRRPVRAKAQPPEASTPALGPEAPALRRGWRGMKRLDWRKRIGLTMRYWHGQDPRVVVTCRGREWSYPWDTAVLDILRDINNR